MSLKKLLFLFIFAVTLIKPTLAVVKEKKSAKLTHKVTKTNKHTYANKHKKAHKKLAVKKDYMHGIASYYGKGDCFNGRQMANGEIFDTDNMFVAAHPTLPLGTKLKVINERNGKVAYVEIKDRMPRGSRIIDLSYAAAGEIGMQHNGLSRVLLVKIDNNEFYKQKHLIETEWDNSTQS